MSEEVACERSDRPVSRPLFYVGAMLIVLGTLPYLGVAVTSEWVGSWLFAFGLAMAFRGYTGGCLSGLLPGVDQCTVDADGSQK